MASDAQARVSFTSGIPELSVTNATFSVPVNVNASGLSEVVSHLLKLEESQRFSFVVIDTGLLLTTSIRNYLSEQHKSTEHILGLKFFPTGKGPEKADSNPVPDWISSICTNLSGYLLVGCYNGSVEIRDALGQKTLQVCGGHRAPTKCVSSCATENGFRMITASKDHTIALWESNQSGTSNENAVNRSTETSSSGSSLNVKRVATGHHTQSVDCVAMANSQQFYSGSWDNTIKIWKWPETTKNHHGNNVNELSDGPAPNKKPRAQLSKSDSHQIYQKKLEIFPTATLTGHTGQVSCLALLKKTQETAISADTQENNGEFRGRYLLSGSWDHSIRLWDTQRFVSLRQVNCGKVVNSIQCLTENGTIYILMLKPLFVFTVLRSIFHVFSVHLRVR